MHGFVYHNFPIFDLKIKLLDNAIIGVEFLIKTPISKLEQHIGKDITIIASQYNEHELTENVATVKLITEIKKQLDLYLKNGKFKFNLPLMLTGTEYQQKVCQQMLAIPAGTMLSYKDIAQKINSSPRAVGNGCGNNKIALFIPCHRVISSSGQLGGFMHMRNGYGLTIKKWLLEHEGTI